MSAPKEIEQIAALWLFRREDRGLSADEAAELAVWLDAAPEHRIAFWRLEHGLEKIGRLAALRTPAGPIPMPTSPKAQPRAVGPLAWAAAVALCLIAGGLTWILADPFGHKTYQTELGGRETVPLADGSKVELNTQTRLRTAVTAEHRDVWLDGGEAYFEVAHDASRPFVVHAGLKTVTVLGTKFSIRRSGDQVAVVVVEGRVRVTDAAGDGDAPPPVLTRGETAIASGAAMIVATRSVERLNADLSWRQGRVTFDQSTLKDAASEFNRYNRIKLVISDPEVAGIVIGGSFDAGNVDAFARLLAQAYGLKVEHDGGNVLISR